MKTKVKRTKTMGRGVFATKDFNKGQIVEVSPCLRISGNHDRYYIQETDVRSYVFSDDAGGTVLALGVGSLFNHDWKPNVTYKYDPVGNCMVFKATRKIRKNGQMFINYGYDPVKENEKWERKKEAELEIRRATPEEEDKMIIAVDALKERLSSPVGELVQSPDYGVELQASYK